MKKFIVFILVFGIPIANVSAQEDAALTWGSERGEFEVTTKSELNPIVINQMHSWLLTLRDARGNPLANAEIAIDGGMPEHNHGLATSPSIEEHGDGQYRIQGLRFHMMGYWELELDITHDGINDSVLITLEL